MDKEPHNIVEFLGEIEDPRRDNANKRHELIDILVIALCGMLSAADDWVSIAQYGRAKEDWFTQFLALPNGIPSHDTFNRVFSRIDPEQFLKWVNSIRSVMCKEIVAVDGKTLRRSHDGENKAAIL
ncbi:ISAs1 family transposase [Microbulbifer sp. TRSA007]|uniref:ISAs1 family transposase n=1 Tax=Microbulbifer sp. TRSA007 TaxID=3243384 RepID=UPI004039E269